MDKSWISKPPLSKEYRDGVKSFINFARKNSSNSNSILCPYVDCTNCHLLTCDEVEEHLIFRGFLQGCIHWFCHGESPTLASFDQFLVQNESYSQRASELHVDSENEQCCWLSDFVYMIVLANFCLLHANMYKNYGCGELCTENRVLEE
ncbi:hypothetical protein SLEP1_g6774 [Rubroshorea leprosula]|uniref:Transposase-associated domain-containing protein n=1 Tax=Rubroshorea leprosula TaxID=152421 RepID=A0AAV5I252_9ROSI|nr:hypothetical protein SLEP1_g6774 [Rubroshorea leprosula]